MVDLLFGLLEVTAACSAVIALLLALRGPLDRRFAPQWRYWAWLAVAVRLCIPFNLSLPQAPVTVAVPQAAVRVERPIVPAGPPQAYLNTAPAPPAVLPPEAGVEDALRGGGSPVTQVWRIPLEQIGIALWAAGAAVFLGVQVLSYVNLKQKIRRWSRQTGEYQGLPVLECDVVMSPMLVGFLRPAIVVPAGGAGEFALLHEHAHARRRDLWYKLLLVLANGVHWFNPLVWAMRRAAAADVEMACDAQVLRGRDEAYRRAYGAALLETVAAARTPGAALTSAFTGNKRSLRQRILSLLDTAPRRPGRAALALLCAAALLGGSLVACGPEEPAAQVPNAPAIPAGDVYDQESGLYFSASVGAGLVVPEALRDKIAPRHRETSAGDPVVEFLDWAAEGETPYFTLETLGITAPQDETLGKAAADGWFQADHVAVLGAAEGETAFTDPVSGFTLTLPGADAEGLILISRQAGAGASWLLCLHREMLGQVTVEDCVSGRSGVFLLSVLDGKPIWDFGWRWDWLALSPEAEAQCRRVMDAREAVTASLTPPVGEDAALNLPPPSEPPEEKTGVVHVVHTETRQITGWWMEGGEIDFDAPFDLGVPALADIQLLDERGYYRLVELEVLAQRVGLLSSWGLPCTLHINTAGRVTGLVEEQGSAVSLRSLATETEGWKFREWRSQNPGDGTYSAAWASMEGISHRLSLTAEAELALTITYTVTEPGEGFTAVLVFPDGRLQSLTEGENAVTLPPGRTAVALGGAEGTAGGFTLSLSPADGVTVNG